MSHNPQEAFFAWLAQSLARALSALRAPDRDLEYLARSIDHADLERRLRALQRGVPRPASPLGPFHP